MTKPKARALVDQPPARPLPDDLEQRLCALEEKLCALLTRPRDVRREQEARVWMQAEGLLIDLENLRRLVWFKLDHVEQRCHQLDCAVSQENGDSA